MRSTPFPSRPSDVGALTIPEFMSEVDLQATASIDAVCRRFIDDVNRALVWFIRFRALTAWCERTDIDIWLKSEPSRTQDASCLSREERR